MFFGFISVRSLCSIIVSKFWRSLAWPPPRIRPGRKTPLNFRDDDAIVVVMSVMDGVTHEPLRRLRTLFGHREFRQGQEEIVAAVLGGRDVLAVMPTGSGKSLGYQLPAVMLRGTTLVVSPLIS